MSSQPFFYCDLLQESYCYCFRFVATQNKKSVRSVLAKRSKRLSTKCSDSVFTTLCSLFLAALPLSARRGLSIILWAITDTSVCIPETHDVENRGVKLRKKNKIKKKITKKLKNEQKKSMN